ncbi:hypothetical protein MMPV_002982 [Pyropia vietnamensis]
MMWVSLVTAGMGAAVAAAVVTTSGLAASPVAAAATVAGVKERPGGLVAAARQTRTFAGVACTTDDDCGGYAVYPPLWCRTGPDADGLTCRSFVEVGQPCGAAALCIGAGNATHPGVNGCIDEVCTVRPPAAVGEPCGDLDCVSGASCLSATFSFAHDGSPRTCVADSSEGEVCGTPTAACSGDLVCGEDADSGAACEGNRCAGGGPGTCRQLRAGDTCDRRSTSFCSGTPFSQDILACVAGVCAPQLSVGSACTHSDECSNPDQLVCAPPTGPSCGFLGCADGVASTCRPLAVGDRCNDGCGDELVCEVVGGAPGQACVRVKREGDACALRGAENVCGTARDTNCTGNTTCGFVVDAPHDVCINPRRGAWGDACGADSDFVRCGARLQCNDDRVCVTSGEQVTVPGKWGWRCSPAFGCEPTVEAGTGAVMECRSSPIRPAGGPRCTFVRSAGAACDLEDPDEPVDCADGLVCAGGECRPADNPRRPIGEACISSDECDGADVATPTAACRGVVNDWLDRCVAVGPVGSACDDALAQCFADSDCIDGQCVGKTPLGSPCSSSEECAFGGECWRGFGAVGPTCREWVGLGAACHNTAAKCWRELRCGDGGVCENPSEPPSGDIVCNTDADCSALDGQLPAVCRERSPGAGGGRRCAAVAPAGEPCAIENTVCADGFRCTRDFTPDWMCARDVGRGVRCQEEPGVFCADGLTCMDGVCGTTGAPGDQCDVDAAAGSGTGCGDGLACRQRSNPDRTPGTFCGTPVDAGERCGDGNWRLCAAGQLCLPETGGPVCKRWRGPGESCGNIGEACWLELICFDGVCS